MSEEKTIPVIEEESIVAEETPDNGVIGEQTVTEDEKEDIESEQTTAEAEKAEEAPKAKKPKKKRRKMHEVTPDNDIKFKGPLSYRHLRIGGWVFMSLMIVSVMIGIGMKISQGYAAKMENANNVLGTLGELALPLFLIANFAVILNAKDGYKKMFITYGALVAALYLLFLVVVNRYLVGILSAVIGDRATARALVGEISVALVGNGYLAFNVFVDLLLCTALTFFLNYRPKKYFKGKLIVLFRLLAILPIVYEVTSLVLKFLAAKGSISLSLWMGPLLATKPPMMFLAFIFLALFIKIREWIFLARGKTRADYDSFLQTNVNSLHFSIVAAVIFLVVAIIDLLLLFLLPYAFIGEVAVTTEEEFELAYFLGMQAVYSMGFGKSLALVVMIPLMFFFSYTRTHKKGKLPVDLIIPAGGFLLVLIVAIESAFQVVCAVLTTVNAAG